MQQDKQKNELGQRTYQRRAEDKIGSQDPMERLSDVFETSAKRWEMVIYPMMLGFALMSMYGFYLIFNLAKDIHYLAISVDSNMTVMSSNMQSMSENFSFIADDMNAMVVNMSSISDKVGTLEPILTNMDSMDNSMRSMTAATNRMTNDMSSMNRTIAKPVNFMNNFMPW